MQEDMKTNQGQNPVHAGVWARGLASFIDLIILLVPFVILGMLFAFPVRSQGEGIGSFAEGRVIFLGVVSHALCFLYFTFQYASKHQATFGMRARGLKITNLNYEKPDMKSLCIRYFLYVIPMLVVLGTPYEDYVSFLLGIVMIIMIALTEKRQVYYDMVAGTYIINTKRSPKD